MTVPHNSAIAARSQKRPDARIPKAVGQAPPRIFVISKGEEFGVSKRAEAHIRVKRGCYRYLRWRESGQVREFYLGKIQKPYPTRELPAPARSGYPAARGPARSVGYKKRARGRKR